LSKAARETIRLTVRRDGALHSAGKAASAKGAPVYGSDEILRSWKAIAVYLQREVRTVQRWEKYESLPVRRHYHPKGASIFALKRGIDSWLCRRSVSVVGENKRQSTDDRERGAENAERLDQAEFEQLVDAVFGRLLGTSQRYSKEFRRRVDCSPGRAFPLSARLL
jgi:hypothetical protein